MIQKCNQAGLLNWVHIEAIHACCMNGAWGDLGVSFE